MERRNFIKLSALTGAMATLTSCGSPDHQLIRFIPDEDLIPGIATIKPSLCTLCSAGCGLQVRVMEGEAEVMRKGQLGLIKMGLAKKLEGNPQYPVNMGKLCAVGQAGVQVLYHPDRVRNPLKRKGQRGSGDFEEISWEDALKELTGQLSALHSGSAGSLAFLSRPLSGQRREIIDGFLKAFGAPPMVTYEPLDQAVLRQANLLSFGHAQLPTLDLARADYVISFGADFLGTWNSPVSQNIGYGQMRQGRVGRRGRFVQVEARMSQTGANADRWVPCRPGTEGVLALGIANVILREKLYGGDPHPHAGSLIAGWAGGLTDYAPEMVEKQTGVSSATIVEVARGVTQGASTAFIGGAPLAHTNGLFNALAVNALAALLDGGKGGSLLSFMPGAPFGNAKAADVKIQGSFAALNALTQRGAKVLMSYEANPVFSAPPSAGIRDAIAKIPYFVSFGNFLDETSILADLILPDHAPLESWLDAVPESGANVAVAGLAAPAVHPLYNTRAMPDVILDLAHGLGGSMATALPWKTFEDKLQASFAPLRKQSGLGATSDDEFWGKVQDQGGWWSVPATNQSAKSGLPAGSAAAGRAAMPTAAAEFDGDAGTFPFYFLPYASQAFHDGSVANLPWMQEMPDVLSTAMWSSWIEINPKTAARLNIQLGDQVEITSPHGTIHAPAVFSPGVAPDVIAMPIGQGHEHFTRYASGRGANPLSIVGTLTEKETGSLAWAATRVKVARSGGAEQGKLVLFSGGLSRFPHPEEYR